LYSPASSISGGSNSKVKLNSSAPAVRTAGRHIIQPRMKTIIINRNFKIIYRGTLAGDM
jgi:hypothetical protein